MFVTAFFQFWVWYSTQMVKKLQFKDTLELVDPQRAFSYLFGDERFVKGFHREVNDDYNAQVTNWDQECCRYVTYTTSVMAPAPIRKAFGTDVLKVKEKQHYKRFGNCFTIVLEPSMEIDHADQFYTRGEIMLSPAEKKSGCVVTVDVYLEFKSNIWGFQGVVEAFMESRAQKTFSSWMAMAAKFCRDELKKSVDGLPELEIDDYFDAQDVENPEYLVEPHQSSGFMSRCRNLLERLMGENHRDSMPELTIEMWFVRSVLNELNTLQITSESSRNYLEKLDAKMQKLEEDIRDLKLCIEDRRYLVSQSTAWSILGVGVTTGVLFAFLYLKYKQHS